MAVVSVSRVDGGFAVSRTFRNMPSAQRALDLLLTINEAAFDPVVRPVAAEPMVDEGMVRMSEMLSRAEQDDPEAHDGRLILPPSADEE